MITLNAAAMVTRLLQGMALTVCAILASCSTPTASSDPELSSPGWEVRQGQALWKPDEKKPEIAGELILNSHPTGVSYLTFSKTMPIVTAKVNPSHWEIDFPPEAKHYSGRGSPPKKIVWLQLIRALDGEKVPDEWKLINPSDRYIALENAETGERLEVRFQK